MEPRLDGGMAVTTGHGSGRISGWIKGRIARIALLYYQLAPIQSESTPIYPKEVP